MTVYVHVRMCIGIWLTCQATLHIILPLQTQATSVPHRGWDKMVYFVCSSLDTKEPAIGRKWSTQKELHDEATLEVQVVIPLVQEYIRKQSPKQDSTSVEKSIDGEDLAHPKKNPSVCVIFPTRLTVGAVYWQFSGYICAQYSLYTHSPSTFSCRRPSGREKCINQKT